MRQIKVTYRARFQQPQGVLNPMGLKLPGDFPVEIFGGNERWYARPLDATDGTKRGPVYTKLTHFTKPEQGMQTVEQSFERCIQGWQLWGTVPNTDPALTQPATVERLLEPDEVYRAPDGKVYLKGPEDYTHILHAPNIPYTARMPPAACGAQVKADCFIDNRANVEPSCKACAEVWRREYQGK